MSIETPAIPPATETPKKNSCLLWGCLSVLLLVVISCCCLGGLILIPTVTDIQLPGGALRDRIEQVIPLDEILNDPSLAPEFDFFQDEVSPPDDPAEMPAVPQSTAGEAGSIPLSWYSAVDFDATFQYPSGWEIEEGEFSVTFYDPDSYTYLYVGEEWVEAGSTAEGVAQDVMATLQEDAAEGTFQLLNSSPWQVPGGADAHLIQMEWTDLDSYFIWAYDLEIVSGESNLFFFLSGEDPAESDLYGELLRIIADSYSQQ